MTGDASTANEKQKKNQQEEPLAGVPRKGIHAYRIPYLDISAVDTAGTALVALATSMLLNDGELSASSFLVHFGVWFGIGFAAHRYFGVNTKGVQVVDSLTSGGQYCCSGESREPLPL